MNLEANSTVIINIGRWGRGGQHGPYHGPATIMARHTLARNEREYHKDAAFNLEIGRVALHPAKTWTNGLAMAEIRTLLGTQRIIVHQSEVVG